MLKYTLRYELIAVITIKKLNLFLIKRFSNFIVRQITQVDIVFELL